MSRRIVSLDAIINSLPEKVGEKERVADYFRRTGFNQAQWVDFVEKNARALMDRGFGMVGHTRSEGKNFVYLRGAAFAYIRRIK